MQAGLRELLDKRRNRSIAIILGVKERDVDPLLKKIAGGDTASNKLRKVVLDQINELHELVLDLMDSLDNGDVHLNEDYLAKIDDLHDHIVGNGNGKPLVASRQ